MSKQLRRTFFAEIEEHLREKYRDETQGEIGFDMLDWEMQEFTKDMIAMVDAYRQNKDA